MAVAKQVIQENDVVALRARVGQWPAGTVGTAVSLYDGASLVEVSDDQGRTRRTTRRISRPAMNGPP